MLHLNIRCLLPKMDYIHFLINETSPEVLVLTKTWLSPKIPNNDISIDEYNIFRCDRRYKGGGVLIYVKDCLTVHEITPCSDLKKYEYIVLDLCFGRDMHVTIVGMYRPPPAHFEALEDIAYSGHCMSWTGFHLSALSSLNLSTFSTYF